MTRRLGGRAARAVAGWHDVGGRRIYCRSRAEHHYAQLLEMQRRAGLITSWEHEPRAYLLPSRGGTVIRYLPDFEVVRIDGVAEIHEVKGWLDPASVAKLRAFAKAHPDVPLRVIGAAWPPPRRKKKAPKTA